MHWVTDYTSKISLKKFLKPYPLHSDAKDLTRKYLTRKALKRNLLSSSMVPLAKVGAKTFYIT